MAATILASGLIAQHVDHCVNYTKEFKHVNILLTARYDIENLPDRSRAVFASLIKDAFHKWWLKSRYNTQIDKVMRDIMKFTVSEVESLGHNICQKFATRLIVDNITDDEFGVIQETVAQQWPGLIAYIEDADGVAVVPKY